MSFRKKKILVCPLNWGLGHATRDVVIIRRLLDEGHDVVLAGDGAALELLRSEFPGWLESGSELTDSDSPGIEIIRLPSRVRVRYSRFLPAWLKITFLSPLLLYEIVAEHFKLAGIIREIEPDVVISDNRYGLWNRTVKSILITHQLWIRLPLFARWLEYPAFLVMNSLISKFDHCWIPDFPGKENLSGELSHGHKLPRNVVFIGAMSRFTLTQNHPIRHTNWVRGSETRLADLLILLSGPEPQRESLQKIILKQVLSLEISCVILQGIPGKFERTDLTSSVTMYNHLPAAELLNLLFSARYVICRAGYTGIMDLALMGKKALLIPTPGQIEQEYLSDYLVEKGLFLACSQGELDLETAMKDLSGFEPVFNLPPEDLLGQQIAEL